MSDRDPKWWLDRIGLALMSPREAAILTGYFGKLLLSDRLAMAGYYNYTHRIIFIAGLPMAATTYIKNIFGRVPGYFTRLNFTPIDVSINQDICDATFRFVPKHGYSLFKTHLNPSQENIDCLSRNGVEKIIVNYRDLRDVVISRYYRQVEFPKSKNEPLYADYNTMNKQQALDHCIELVGTNYVEWINGWRDFAKQEPDKVCFVKFEDLISSPTCEFVRMLDFYDLRFSEKKVEWILNAARGRGTVGKNMRSARILPFAYASNFRTGKSGYWKDELSPDQKDKCRELMGELLIELDYESGTNW